MEGSYPVCGIVGVLDPRARWSREQLHVLTHRLNDTLVHRGPDGEGVWAEPDGGLALGHRRLAVVDLSEHGAQPMESANGRFVITFNGEIYNHAQLRALLARQGVTFRGHCDTEVFLEAISVWGLGEALRRSNGMWAVAVWDRRERRLSLVRDRLGEKPFYYAWFDGVFVFGSELSTLRAYPGCTDELDPDAVALFLEHGFVPAPHSILSGVRTLPAGHRLDIDRGSCEASVREWWSLSEVAAEGLADPCTDEHALVDECERLLRDSVRLRREADVPVGTFLSGGIDSALVTAALAADGPVRTFTIAVGGSADESDRASRVARHLGTEHTTLELAEPTPEQVLGALGIYDEPFADPSALPTALLCASVRSEVTVALSGDGGDETFAGYNRYKVATGMLGRLSLLPYGARRRLGRLARAETAARHVDRWVGRLPAGMRIPDTATKVHKLSGVLDTRDTYDAYLRLARVWQPGQLLSARQGPPTAMTNFARHPDGDVLRRMLYADTAVTLPDNMLVKVDRASMAVGLELRVPLLDHRLVELSWRAPRRTLVRGGQGKWLLRQVLKRHLPASLVDAPKMGFDPPLGAWLRGPLRPWAEDLLDADRLRSQGLDPAPVRTTWDQHLAGTRDATYEIWTVLALQAWRDRSIAAVTVS